MGKNIIYHGTNAAVPNPKILFMDLGSRTFTYNGHERKPSIKIKDSTYNILIAGTDYIVSYSGNCAKVGMYAVTIQFK